MSNKRLKRTLEFDLTDANMLMHAMMIAANSAMMCGNHAAQSRLKYYYKMLERFVPQACKIFSAEKFAEIGLALPKAERVYISFHKKYGAYYNASITVRINHEQWVSDRFDSHKDCTKLKDFVALIKELADVDTIIEESVNGEATYS